MYIRKFSFCLLVICFCVLFSLGQGNKSQKEFFPSIEEKYDKFTKTKSVVASLPFSNNRAENLTLFFVYHFSNGDTLHSDVMLIRFIYTIDEKKFISGNQRLIFLVDGEPLDLGQLETIEVKKVSRFVNYLVGKKIPTDIVKQLLRAKNIEGRLGSIEFQFGETQIAGIQDFARKIGINESRNEKDLSESFKNFDLLKRRDEALSKNENDLSKDEIQKTEKNGLFQQNLEELIGDWKGRYISRLNSIPDIFFIKILKIDNNYYFSFYLERTQNTFFLIPIKVEDNSLIFEAHILESGNIMFNQLILRVTSRNKLDGTYFVIKEGKKASSAIELERIR